MKGYLRSGRTRLAAVIGLLLALVPTGCSTSEQTQTLVVMLVDVTASTVSARDHYLQAVDKVLSELPDGGRLVVVPIDVDSSVNPVAFDETLPRLRWSLDPKAGNERTHKKAREAIRQQARDGLSQLLDGPRSTQSGTSIIDAVAYADRIIKATPEADPYVVILSDMIEQSDLDFTTLPEEQIEAAVDQLKGQDRLPIFLDTVKVYVAGIAAGEAGSVRLPDGRLRAIESFWQKFFTTSGATVKWYGPTLLNFCVGSQCTS
jgi:hypothetical protein